MFEVKHAQIGWRVHHEFRLTGQGAQAPLRRGRWIGCGIISDMKTRHRSGAPEQKEVTTEQLRDLLGEITYHWSHDEKVMNKTRRVLLRLIGDFARNELHKSNAEQLH